jgi:hypothetical protein
MEIFIVVGGAGLLGSAGGREWDGRVTCGISSVDGLRSWPSLFEYPQSNTIEGRRHMY